MNKKTIVGIVLSAILFILEIIAMVQYATAWGYYDFKYYTLCSNFLAMVFSGLWIIKNVFKIENKVYHNILKYLGLTTALCLTVTFVVVLTILVPLAMNQTEIVYENGAFYHYVLEMPNLFHHLICPILFVCLFIFVYDYQYKKYIDNLYSIIFTILYAIVLIILCAFGVCEPPYPFLDVQNNTIGMDIVWFIVIIGAAILFSLLITFLNSKYKNRKNK